MIPALIGCGAASELLPLGVTGFKPLGAARFSGTGDRYGDAPPGVFAGGGFAGGAAGAADPLAPPSGANVFGAAVFGARREPGDAAAPPETQPPLAPQQPLSPQPLPQQPLPPQLPQPATHELHVVQQGEQTRRYVVYGVMYAR